MMKFRMVKIKAIGRDDVCVYGEKSRMRREERESNSVGKHYVCAFIFCRQAFCKKCNTTIIDNSDIISTLLLHHISLNSYII